MSETFHSKSFDLIPRIIDGCIGGALGVTFIYPIDLAKTRLQNQRTGQYKGLFDCLRKTFRSEGLMKMYKGCPLNAALMAPETAIKMTVNDICRRKLTGSDGRISMMGEIVAGGCAGVCQSFVSTPMELIKIQLQDHGRTRGPLQTSFTGVSPLPESSFSIARSIVKTGGVLSLYTGGWPTIYRNIVFAIIYFPLFANLNSLRSENVFWWSLSMGWVSASISASLTTPLDVVKTRMQTLKKGVGEETYKGVGEAFYKIMKSEGVMAVFKGMVGRSIIIGPVFGISQMVYFSGFSGYIPGVKELCN